MEVYLKYLFQEYELSEKFLLVKYTMTRITKIDVYLMNILQKGNNNFFFRSFV
jgi:hypothetical protein